MENNSEDQKRLILAVVLSAGILMGWQYFFPAPKNNFLNEETKTQSTNSKVVNSTSSSQMDNEAGSSLENDQLAKVQPQKYVFPTIGGKSFSFDQSFNLIDAKNPEISPSFADVTGVLDGIALQLIVKGKEYSPQITWIEKEVEYWKGVDNSVGLTLVLKPMENGDLQFSYTLSHPYRFQLLVDSQPKEKNRRDKRQYIFYGKKDVKREVVGDDFSGESDLKWFGIDFDYHMLTYLFESPIFMSYQGQKDGQFKARFQGAYDTISGRIFFVKKEYDGLRDRGENLKLAVDYGFFAIVALPIFRGLQFIYNYIPNYGVAIIILTFLLRIVTYPLQLNSMKSMKKMQKIQPQLNKIRERYKDDPQRLNMETMAFFKREKVNPMGGCFPLLLQMPIFIAFYQVLYSSVELVGAPFMGWITDLSIKDPYYVLPILMCIVMFLQQKMSPTSPTMDPMQKKMMMFMPLVFGFIMIEMPAGLTLYWFVSTALGVLQQVMVNKYVTT